MSWKNIIKAPTLNRDSKFPASYRGNRNLSYIDDKMMEKIVKDLGLPETDTSVEDGEKIEYEEEPDFRLSPSIKALPNELYELEIKFEGKILIWGESARTPAHTFTKDDIEFESFSLDIGKGLFSLDYEFSQYHNGKIYLEIIIEKQ